MIDIRKLKELVRLMVAHELTELDLRDSEEQVTLRRHVSGPPGLAASMPPGAWSSPMPYPAGAIPAVPAGAVTVPDAEDQDEGLHRITSPMVGTFYAAPSPDAAPFVAAGSAVEAETVVCVIEAMKIFNEIKAECGGTIERVLVSNGESVEFGQPLFLVRTD